MNATTLRRETARCEICGCTWHQPCPQGCAWDELHWARGHAVCTACSLTPFSAEPVITVSESGDFMPALDGAWQLFVTLQRKNGRWTTRPLLAGPKSYIETVRDALNAISRSYLPGAKEVR